MEASGTTPLRDPAATLLINFVSVLTSGSSPTFTLAPPTVLEEWASEAKLVELIELATRGLGLTGPREFVPKELPKRGEIWGGDASFADWPKMGAPKADPAVPDDCEGVNPL